ncbi:Mbeg1-like protein [Methylomonas sp. AM2-LC]|uniref:lipase family protein n=1 Tax=Methylomonas sp. AM2-LC TaxID=3153301 RepID=UPI00326517F5
MKYRFLPLLITLLLGLFASVANADDKLEVSTAYRMAEAAKCSYYTEGFLKTEMSVIKCLQNATNSQELSRVTDKDIYSWTEDKDGYILVSTQNEVILAMRGTLPPIPHDGADFITIKDWLNDFSALPDNDGFHRGFIQSWNHIKTNLEQEKAKSFLENAFKENTNKKFMVTGHSKAGALAIIAAIKMSKSQGWTMREPDGVYSFEGARPLTAKGAKPYVGKLSKLYRIEYKNDIVPLVPPGAWLKSKENKIPPILANVFSGVKDDAYDSLGLGTLYYIDNDNNITIVKDEHAILASRIQNIASVYTNALSPTEAFRAVVAKQLPMCLPVENNHTAHIDYLQLKVEGKDLDSGAFVASSWDKYCNLDTLSGAVVKDAMQKLGDLCVGPCDFLRNF